MMSTLADISLEGRRVQPYMMGLDAIKDNV